MYSRQNRMPFLLLIQVHCTGKNGVLYYVCFAAEYGTKNAELNGHLFPYIKRNPGNQFLRRGYLSSAGYPFPPTLYERIGAVVPRQNRLLHICVHLSIGFTCIISNGLDGFLGFLQLFNAGDDD